MLSELVTSILARYPPIVRPLAPPVALENAGGHSGARLWRFLSGRGMLVLRAWPQQGMEFERLRRTHGWLARAGRLGFIPVPEVDIGGQTIQELGGRLWELAPWMPGAADLARPPRPPRLAAGFAGLASLHAALGWDRAIGPSASLVNRVAEMEHLVRGGFESLTAAVDRASNDPRHESARHWLRLARGLAPRYLETLREAASRSHTLRVCLRDARPDHFLFEDDRLAGLVDFGAMGLDLIEGDLARLLAEWVGGDQGLRADALAAYVRVSPLDETSLPRIAVFENSAALLGAGHWIRWHFVEGRVFEDPNAVGRGIARGIERLAELTATSLV